jgi:hypothetical protein
VDYLVVTKATDNVYYCVALTYVRQKFVSKSLAMGRTADKTGYVNKFNNSGRAKRGIV